MLIRANLVFFCPGTAEAQTQQKNGDGMETKRLQTFEQNVDEFVFGVAVVAVVVVTVVTVVNVVVVVVVVIVVVGVVTVVVIIVVTVAVVIFEQILPH